MDSAKPRDRRRRTAFAVRLASKSQSTTCPFEREQKASRLYFYKLVNCAVVSQEESTDEMALGISSREDCRSTPPIS
ncbi:hypothetical protein SDC9_53970 [bioreactor metagenome]|uniref:Uncharacterized protein n=1 Tax=bioreactor metagenome TaxID=1076179 RepID=A0A644X052_9ZZZZ